MGRRDPGAGRAIAEVPAVGEAGDLVDRARVRRAGREADRNADSPRGRDVDAGRRRAQRLTVTTTELLLERLLASVTVTEAV